MKQFWLTVTAGIVVALLSPIIKAELEKEAARNKAAANDAAPLGN